MTSNCPQCCNPNPTEVYKNLPGFVKLICDIEKKTKISNSSNNLLKSTSNGLEVNKEDIKNLATVDVQDAFGVHLYYALP